MSEVSIVTLAARLEKELKAVGITKAAIASKLRAINLTAEPTTMVVPAGAATPGTRKGRKATPESRANMVKGWEKRRARERQEARERPSPGGSPSVPEPSVAAEEFAAASK